MSDVPAQVSCTNLLMDKLVELLTDELITDLAPVDETEFSREAVAGLIRKGKLQDDPTIYGVTLLVHPATQDQQEELYDRDTHNGFQIERPFEIGGPYASYFWVKPMNIQLTLFFDGEQDREVAQTKAQVVLSRARAAIYKINGSFRDIPRDDFGEKAHVMLINKAYLREGGGSGTFIWRGKIVVQFLTDVDLQDV